MQLNNKPRRLILNMSCSSECHLELWGVEQHRDLLEKVFGLGLELRLDSMAEVGDRPSVSV
jgi:hypothetical protein